MYNLFLLSALNKCKTGEAVDAAFDRRKITDRVKRIQYLTYCMGNPEISYGGKEDPDPEKELLSKYVTLRSAFITGSWRF